MGQHATSVTARPIFTTPMASSPTQAMQAARRAQQQAEMKEAKKLLQLSEMRGLPYDPTKDGFVFSTAEIHAALDKERRLHRASLTDFTRHKPKTTHAKAA